jgi:hypothetical protein
MFPRIEQVSVTEYLLLIKEGFVMKVTSKTNKEEPMNQNGRRAALGVLDKVLENTENAQTLREGLQKSLRDDPTLFFKEIVMPLTPKEMRIESTGVQKKTIRVITTAKAEDAPGRPSAELPSESTQPEDVVVTAVVEEATEV